MNGQNLAGKIRMRTAIECRGYDCRATEHDHPKWFTYSAVSGRMPRIVYA